MNSAAVSSSAASLPLPTRWEWDGIHLILRNGHQAADGKAYDLRLSIWQPGPTGDIAQPLSLKGRAIPQTADVRVQKLFNAAIKQIALSPGKIRFICQLPDSGPLKSCSAIKASGPSDVTHQKIQDSEKEEVSTLLGSSLGEPTLLQVMQGMYDAVFPTQLVSSSSCVQPVDKEPPLAAVPALMESSSPELVETSLSVSASPQVNSAEDEYAEEPQTVARAESPLLPLALENSVDRPDSSSRKSSISEVQIEVEASATPHVAIDAKPTVSSMKYSLPANWKQFPHSVLYVFQEVSCRLADSSVSHWLDNLRYADLQSWKKDWPSSETPEVVAKAETAILCLQKEGFGTKNQDAIDMLEWLKQLHKAGVSHLLSDKEEEMQRNQRKYRPDLRVEQYVKHRVAADLILNLKIFIGSGQNLDRFIGELSEF